MGPMTEIEIESVRARLAGHETCGSDCRSAPNGETARLLATIDAQHAVIEKRLAAYNEEALAFCNDLGAQQLHEGARTMRAACSGVLRSVAETSMRHGGMSAVLAMMAKEYANAIDTLPLPEAPSGMSPAPGVRGLLLYQDERVMVCRVTLEPGAAWPEETHPEHSETISVVAGRVAMEGGDWAAFSDGSVADVRGRRVLGVQQAFIAAGTAHRVINASETDVAEYISVLRRV